MPNFEPGSAGLCGDCILTPPPFSGARSFGYYTGELGKLVRALKFQNRRNLSEILVPFMADTFAETWGSDDFDVVIPVPLHPGRRRARGYNQSELLARSLATRVGVPFHNRILVRRRQTAPQTGLTDSRRKENVRNAFSCVDPEGVAGRRILLVDDVMTTGATVASASGTLMKSGALRVSVLTLARTEK
jgi:ComF family protein